MLIHETVNFIIHSRHLPIKTLEYIFAFKAQPINQLNSKFNFTTGSTYLILNLALKYLIIKRSQLISRYDSKNSGNYKYGPNELQQI